MPAPVQMLEPVVRRLEHDEDYVVNAFERHAAHCPRCEDPIKTFDEDNTLCDRGNQYAIDVDKYIYAINDMAHSVVDRELNQATLVQIPMNCESTRRLLLAVQYGLPLRRKEVRFEDDRQKEKDNQNHNQHQRQRSESPARPVISYDRSYPIAPRRPASQSQTLSTEVIERSPQRNMKHRVIVYPSSSSSVRSSSSTRGSLYEEDLVDRVDRRRPSPRRNWPIDYHL